MARARRGVDRMDGMISNLLAFAAGAQLTIESNAMVTVDDDLAGAQSSRA